MLGGLAAAVLVPALGIRYGEPLELEQRLVVVVLLLGGILLALVPLVVRSTWREYRAARARRAVAAGRLLE